MEEMDATADVYYGKLPLLGGTDQNLGEMTLLCRDLTAIKPRMPLLKTAAEAN
jgi:hypothetical protein